jgi:adenylate kinase
MKATILAAVVLAFSVNQALAVSRAVKIACRSDYFAHCSMHAVGSPGLRQCMRAVGPNLSRPCIAALIEAGEVGGKKSVAAKPTYAKAAVVKKRYAKVKVSKKYAAKMSKRKQANKAYGKKRYAEKASKKYVRYAERY